MRYDIIVKKFDTNELIFELFELWKISDQSDIIEGVSVTRGKRQMGNRVLPDQSLSEVKILKMVSRSGITNCYLFSF